MSQSSLDELIEAAIEDGVLTDMERQVLDKKATEAGWDLDEFHVILEGRLQKKQKELKPETIPAPKQPSNKYGGVRKCPACGAQISAGTAICPECGHEFVGVGAVSSIEKLSKLIEDASQRDSAQSAVRQLFAQSSQVVSVIKNFPIPNTAEDLLEFCLVCETRGKNDKTLPVEYAYYEKYRESVNKAKTFFGNDSRFQPLITRFDKTSRKMSGYTKKLLMSTGGLLLMFLFLLLMIALLTGSI